MRAARIFSANLLNPGAYNANESVDFGTSNGVYDIERAFTIAAGQTMTLTGSSFSQNNGTLEIDGALNVDGMSFNYGGGTINGTSGTPYLIGSQLNLEPQAVNPATFWITGSASTITGNIQAGQTVWVRGSGPGSSTSFVVTNGFVNSGTLRLESVDGGYNTYFYINNGALTNAGGGVVNINNGEGGARIFSANLLNQGAFNANESVAFGTSNGVYENDGAFTIAAGQTMTLTGSSFSQNNGTLEIDGALNVDGMSFNYGGGTINGASGTPYLIGSQLNLGSAGCQSRRLLDYRQRQHHHRQHPSRPNRLGARQRPGKQHGVCCHQRFRQFRHAAVGISRWRIQHLFLHQQRRFDERQRRGCQY